MGGKIKLLPLKSGIRKEFPLYLSLFNVVLEFLARVIRQEEEIKGIKIGKEEFKLSLFVNDMIFGGENCTKKLLDIINTFSKVPECKITYKNQKPIHLSTMNRLGNNIGNSI
jgi:hypothetical protein